MPQQAIDDKREECIKELAEWFAKHRRLMRVRDMCPIAEKYFGTGEELTDFYEFVATTGGRELFKKHLRLKAWELGLAPKEGEKGFWLGIAGAERKFPLGRIVMTRGVNDLVAENAEFAKFVTESLRRHARGDWGDLPEEDKKENEYALTRHLRLFSAYIKPPLPKIWIITEADRSATTTLFPEEY